MRKLRLIAWTVQPVVVLDDGENLTEVPVQAQKIPAAQWEAFKAGGDKQALERLETAMLQTPPV